MKALTLLLVLALAVTVVACSKQTVVPAPTPTDRTPDTVETPQQAQDVAQQTVETSIASEGDDVQLGELV